MIFSAVARPIPLIDIALETAKGNQGIAATMLGLKRATLSMRLKNMKKRN